MRPFFGMLIAWILQSCNQTGSTNITNKRYIPAQYVVDATELMADVAKMLECRHPEMVLMGDVGGMAETVNVIGLVFCIRGPQSKEHLRYLLVDSVEALLAAFNRHESLRPHLKHYPLTPNEIEISIFVEFKDGSFPLHPNICDAHARHGDLVYSTVEDSMQCDYTTRIREDYYEAKKTLYAESQSDDIEPPLLQTN